MSSYIKTDADADADTGIDEWPTTQRFSRRLGEAVPDARYACAIERPPADLFTELARYVVDLSRAIWEGGRHRSLMRESPAGSTLRAERLPDVAGGSAVSRLG